MGLRSHIDVLDESHIVGWATLDDDPSTKLKIDVLHRGVIIGQCVADKFRPDLKEAGIGDGACAFDFAMPPFLPKSELGQVEVRCGAARLGSNGPPTTEMRAMSQFGGLWIDRPDFLDVIGRKCWAGEISEEIAARIFRFARDGYVVIERVVASELIDRLNKEIEKFWQNPPPGLMIEVWEGMTQRFLPPAIEHREGTTKLLDVHAFSSLARAAIAAPKAMEFLRAIFQDKPKAFQSLSFWKGSQQDIHKDTAYVKIDSGPMHLAATWLALEDVEEGTGELEYYVGSHRTPEYLFGTSKWMEHEPDQHAAFLQSLDDDAVKYGHPRRSFLPKKGDLLIWHADLAHGGAAIKKPGRTRKSSGHALHGRVG